MNRSVPRSTRLAALMAAALSMATAAAWAQPVASAGLPPAAAMVGGNLPQMFLHASGLVQAVMLGLLLTSVLSWATLFVKLGELRRAGRTLAQAGERLQLAPSLAEVAGVDDTAVWAMLSAARRETDRSADLQRAGLHDGVKERIAAALQRVEEAQSQRMGRGLNILASVGSVSPFVGLFGTVWGIMHSFIDIAHSNTTSLAVVAPGIAEALLATAFGLGAAIPATLMYNLLGRRITDYRARLADNVVELLCLASRDADRMRMTAADAPALPEPSAVAGREGRVVAFHGA